MSHASAAPSPVRTIGDLISHDLAVEANTSMAKVVRIFESHPDVDSLAVLGGGRIQLVSRARFFLQLGRRFGYALFENRPVSLLAEEGSVVEAAMEPIEVIQLATQRKSARIYDDILVVELPPLLRAAEPHVEGRPVRLQINLRALPPAFPADPAFLRRIVSHFLNNPLDFTDMGTIEPGAEGSKEGIVLWVKDSGIGIRAGDLPRLFTRFACFEPVRVRRRGGAGLGLVIAKGLTECLGGVIRMESHPRVGTTASVHLPLPPGPGPAGG
jgi:signal transduction histidine kinase